MGDQRTEATFNGSTADTSSNTFSLRRGLSNLGIQVTYSEEVKVANSLVDEDISISADTFTETAHGFETGLVGTVSAVATLFKLTPAACFNLCCSTNDITEVGHAFISGERGRFTTSITLPSFCCALIIVCTDYYVIVVDPCSYQVADSRANALAVDACCNPAPIPVNITATGCGNHTFTPNGVLPTGLCSCACMAFIIKVDDDTYQLSATRGGSAQDITALGAPAEVIFTPTTPAGACGNSIVSFDATIDGVNFVDISADFPDICLVACTCASSSIVTKLDAVWNEVRVTNTVTLGQWSLDVDIVGKE